MNLSRLTTDALLVLRQRAEYARDWSYAKLITDELARRGKLGEGRAA